MNIYNICVRDSSENPFGFQKIVADSPTIRFEMGTPKNKTMSEENNLKPIVGLLGGNQTGKTAIMEEGAREAESTGIKVHVFKAPTSDISFYGAPISPADRLESLELIKALQKEQLSQVGRSKWWEIKGWSKTLKKR